MKKFLFCFSGLIIWIFYLGGCSISNDATICDSGFSCEVKMVCWNVQTFFDAKIDGNEYSEFKKEESWNSGKYRQRLERLCEVMNSLNADIFVFEEIESLGVVQDISNFLTNGSWLNSKKWNYACFSRNCGSAIGCAVFSRFPIKELTVHNVDVRIYANEQPSSRPIMQVCLEIDKKDLVLFVNHWKSKSGGEVETEIWRDWQEALLGERLVRDFSFSGKNAYILCGDFNRSAEDFVCDFEGAFIGAEIGGKFECADANVVLRTFGQGKSEFVCVYSPWFGKSGGFKTEKGSYFYKGSWERIDNIFSFGSLKISGFMVESEGNLAKEDGSPFRYSVYNGEGYSDHFPLVCSLLL